MHSRISPIPTQIYQYQCVSAFHRGEWHRAMIIGEHLHVNGNNLQTIEVNFLDLGLRKHVIRFEHIKEVEQKFFNFPLKAILCTINLDEELWAMMDANERNRMQPMRLDREAQTFFTRVIYDKIMFAKVLSFTHGCVFKIKLCTQTSRGNYFCI